LEGEPDMSEIGVSTSCFYPLQTELALQKVGECGFNTTEIFINAYSELDKAYIERFKSTLTEFGMNLVSVHMTESFADGYHYFSDYYRRYEESLDVFRRHAHLAAELKAKYLVMHGMKNSSKSPDELYCERFSELCDIAAQYGVSLLQENVVNFRSETPDFIEYMKQNIGEKFAMVLDIKQARRAGVDPFDYVKRHHDIIKHVHISDYNSEHDCITPLKGSFDFERLFREMKVFGYTGDYIIELYRHSYSDVNEIVASAEELSEILKRAM
jgi:sugar phosphate isomerase/epimerase